MKRIIKSVYRNFFYGAYPLLKLLPLKEETIIFESFIGRKYNDSPRIMFEYMKTRYPQYNYVWVVNEPQAFDIDGAKVIKRLTPQYFFTVGRAKYIINNSRMPIFFKKRSNQVFIQTWHGTPLKKLVYDMETNVMSGTNAKKYLEEFSNEVKNWDYLVSANQYSTDHFKTAFRFEGDVLQVGYPRNEFLHNHTSEDVKRVRAEFGIRDDEVVVLYTPTYRDNQSQGKGKYFQKIKLDLDLLEKTSGIKVLLRVHYLVSETLELSNYKNIINVSQVEDINQLYIMSDALLNDYSSTMFDYLILNKPIILFAYDLEEYEREIRGFYMDYNKLPGEQISSTERLIEIMRNLKGYEKVWEEELAQFRKEMILDSEAQASEKIIDKIFKENLD